MSKYALHWLLLVGVFVTACSEKLPDFSDRKGPTVLSVTPADGETGVSVEASIVVQFSEAILFRKKISRAKVEEFDYAGFVVSDADGSPVTGFLSFNNDTVTFRGAAPFQYGAEYKVSINDRVKDLFGNRATPFEWKFSTEPDTVPPYPPYGLSYSPLTKTSPTSLQGAKEAGTIIYVNDVAAPVGADNTNFSLSLPLVEGKNQFTLHTRDLAGNESTPVTISIELDSIKPSSLTMCEGTGLLWHFEGREACWNPPVNEPIVWNNFRLPLGAQWLVPEENANAIFELGEQGVTFSETRFTYDGFNPRLVTGTVKLRAYTRDAAGNESDAKFERDFKYDALSTIEMTPHAMFEPSGIATTWTTSAESVLQFRIESEAKFSATLGGDSLAFNCVADAPGRLCSVTLPDAADGSYQFVAAATDAAGNVARLSKLLYVDRVAPVIYTLPGAGAITNTTPILHVFANEPVTGSALILDAFTSVTPTLDEHSNGRHWTYQLPFVAGSFDLSATVYDRAGNQTQAQWSFTVGSPTSASAGYSSVATGAGQSGIRDGWLTITMPAAPLHVLRWDNGGEAGFAFTTATAITIATNPLTQLHGELETFNADGASAKIALPNDLWDTEATLSDGLVAQGAIPVYLRLFVDADPANGFTVFAQDGSAYRLTPDGMTQYEFLRENCTDGYSFPTFAYVSAEAPYAVLGKPCEQSTHTGVTVMDLSTAGLSAPLAFPLWEIPTSGETSFGVAITANSFFANGKQQFAVGSPNAQGKVYLFDGTAATEPTFVLKGDPLAGNWAFGESAAFANNHHHGRSTLAIVAKGEPAVYFFENDLTANTLTPLPKYRARVPLEIVNSTEVCTVAGRYEVINAGDMDGDGGEDLVTASWADICPLSTMDQHFDVILNFFFSNGEASSHRVATTYWRQNGLARARLIPLGDLNGDGLADVGHIDRTDGGLVRVYYGSADGKPVSRLLKPFAVGANENWVLAGAADIDGDGYSELILAKSTGLSTLALMAWP